MNNRLAFSFFILSVAFLASSCSPPAQLQPPSASVTPATTPVTAKLLAGDWARVLILTGEPDPRTAHYWLRLTLDGAFALTTNKMQFETNVTHQGAYSLDGELLTFSAQAGSQKCAGETASYQVTMYEDGLVEFLPIAVPCEKWLNIGAGALGEETAWVRITE